MRENDRKTENVVLLEENVVLVCFVRSFAETEEQ